MLSFSNSILTIVLGYLHWILVAFKGSVFDFSPLLYLYGEIISVW